MRSFYTTRHGRTRTAYYRSAEEQLVERLTNWQRKQWAPAGYPRGEDELRRFARLQRDGSEVWVGEVLDNDRGRS